MNFSQFAKALYPFYGAGLTETDFIIEVTNKIMEHSSDENNPLKNLKPDFRKRIFEGSRSISRKNAATILNSLDKIRFEEYINGLTDDARRNISNYLGEYGYIIPFTDVAFQCAEILENILKNIASGKLLKLRSDTGVLIGVPFNNLPHKRNPFFTGREEKLNSIKENFKKKDIVSLTQSITGLGGVGKTSIALEYAYKKFNDYKTIWWVNAESEQTTLDSFRDLGLKKKIIPEDANAAEIIEVVKNWFNDSENKSWLFIYDNADADSFSKWFVKYLPQAANGHVIITTRSNFFPHSEIINIDIFSVNETLSFLKKRTGKNGQGYSDDLAEVLAERLQYLPLALEQAAAYIEQTPDTTYQDYIDLIEKYGTNIFKTKNYLVDYASTIAITWKISMDKITNGSAVQMFNMCAYFAPVKIPVDIFIRGNEDLPADLKNNIADDVARNDIIRDLTRYSLLSCEIDNGISSDENRVLYMHRLLQEVVQRSFAENTEWLENSLLVIAHSINWKKGEKSSVESFKIEYPHAIAVAEKSAVACADNEEYYEISGMVFNAVGQLLSDIGSPNNALKYFSKGLNICLNIHCEEHADAATAYNNIGYIYRELGQPKIALEHYQKALAILKNIYGEEHPHIAASYNNIGYIHNTMGEPKTALFFYDKALEMREKINGKGHLDNISLYSNIGTIYSRMGEMDMALDYYFQGLKIREETYGVEHVDTAMSYNNIGAIYADSGRPQKAIEYYNKALLVYERVYGKEDIKVAVLYSNIGDVYRVSSKFDEAMKYYMDSLKINKRVYGNAHPNTATIYNNIAALYANQSEFEKSLDYHKKALRIRINILGEQNTDTAISYNNIGEVYRSLKKTNKALNYFTQALSIFESIHGKEQIFTATIYNNFAAVYADTGKPEKALEYFNKALVILENIYGEEQIHTATTYNNMALIYITMGEFETAIEYFKKSLIIREKAFGREAPDLTVFQEIVDNLLESLYKEDEL